MQMNQRESVEDRRGGCFTMALKTTPCNVIIINSLRSAIRISESFMTPSITAAPSKKIPKTFGNSQWSCFEAAPIKRGSKQGVVIKHNLFQLVRGALLSYILID